MKADLFVITGCGHEPRADFVYPVISHVAAQDCGNRLAVRVLDCDGKTRLIQVSCARLLELVGSI